MADPKGPGTGDGAKGSPSARPRSPTLDLPAKDVSAKPEVPKAEPPKEEPIKSAAPKPDAVTPEPPKTASAPSAASPGPVKTAETPKPSTEPQARPANGPTTTSTAAAPEKPTPPKPATETPKAAQPSSTDPSTTASAPIVPVREGVGPLGVMAAAVGGAALAVLAIALFGKQLIGLQNQDMTRVAAAESKLDAVGRDVAALREQLAKTAQTADTSAIDARLGELSKSIEASNGRVGGVESGLRELSEEVAKPRPADPSVGVLTGRVSGIELRLKDTPTAESIGILAGRVAGMEARSAELPSRQAIEALGEKVDAIGQTVGQKIGAATAPIAQRVDTLASALEAKPQGDPQARLVVALGALDQALADGRAFAPELAAVKAAAGESADLAALDPYAGMGVPTRAALGATLAAEIAALPPLKSDASASLFDKFAANIGGVVKVTPQGGATGDDPAALRARVAQAAAAGDIESALATRGRLDEAARAATEEWAALASARVSAENALKATRAAALARLSSND